MGHGGVYIQLIGAVIGLLPVFGGVMVAVFLRGKGAGHHADAQRHGQ